MRYPRCRKYAVSLLTHACYHSEECVKVLLLYGAHVSKRLYAALQHWARSDNRHLSTLALLEKDVPSKQEIEGWFQVKKDRYLLQAAREGSVHGILRSLEAGADVTATTDSLQTALHLAVRYGCIHQVEILLGAGADKAAVNQEGSIPLDLLKHPLALRGNREDRKECAALLYSTTVPDLQIQLRDDLVELPRYFEVCTTLQDLVEGIDRYTESIPLQSIDRKTWEILRDNLEWACFSTIYGDTPAEYAEKAFIKLSPSMLRSCLAAANYLNCGILFDALFHTVQMQLATNDENLSLGALVPQELWACFTNDAQAPGNHRRNAS